MRGPGALRGYEKPKNARRVILRLLSYLKARKWTLLIVIVLMLLSSASGLAGNYFLKQLNQKSEAIRREDLVLM